MDIPKPDEGDFDIGGRYFAACWALTAITGLVLLFRYGAKIWIASVLPKVASSERVWGLEDTCFAIAYLCDLVHMSFVEKSHSWGLGRHFYYLSPLEKNQSIKYEFLSQPFGVASSMFSRTGMMWFLYQCFGVNNKRLRPVLISCMAIQIVVNLITILQIILQCGPNPYRPSNRVDYFHYIWDPIPEDGSVVCQDPTVQGTVGFIQGAFNTLIDFFLAYTSAVELWQHLFKTMNGPQKVSWSTQYRRMNPTVRSRRIWQTIVLSGPLLLSGVASIVKTVLLKFIADKFDITYNLVSFVLWVKIENYSILIASCAPILRTFLRTFVEQRREGGGSGGGAYGSRSGQHGRGLELGHSKKSKHSTTDSSGGFRRMGSQDELVDEIGSVGAGEREMRRDGSGSGSGDGTVGVDPGKGGVKIETDIFVEVDEEGGGNGNGNGFDGRGREGEGQGPGQGKGERGRTATTVNGGVGRRV